MSTFENVEILEACERICSKLSNDTNFLKIELRLLKIREKMVPISYYFLYILQAVFLNISKY